MTKPISLSLFRFTNGNDVASYSGGWKVSAGDTVNTLNGKNKITTETSAYSAIDIQGTLRSGNGADVITATNTKEFGDAVVCNGLIDVGSGGDKITGTGYCGIFNLGRISMGAGNDTITGIAVSAYGFAGHAIDNRGTIDMGDGDDIVDALKGGFSCGSGNDISGTINMGSGNDIVKGFGAQHINGGPGVDRLVFGSGSYQIRAVAGIPGVFSITNGTAINGDLCEMFVCGFEKIKVGSANFNFRAGIFTAFAF